MELLKFIAFFDHISVMEWIVLGASALFVFWSFIRLFKKETPKRKGILGIIIGLLYACVFSFVVNEEYILDSQTGCIFLVAINILMIVTSLCGGKDFFDSLALCITQLAIYIPVALILWGMYTVFDSFYKDDVYSSYPYYLLMQLVIFGTSLIYKLVLLKYITSVNSAKKSKKTTSNINKESTSSTTSQTSTKSPSSSYSNGYSSGGYSSSYDSCKFKFDDRPTQSSSLTSTESTQSQVEAHGNFLKKQLDGTLTPEERDQYDRKWV